ncbi:class I SAM-dependent methyltransferase [Alloalcanivorax sp. C16-2]|uniref:class I SAM-dependent methyltransferase n=1 Tax=Alloalcanivorax sp. C16-2 TaxID=3390052 RepID=UPI003970F7A6
MTACCLCGHPHTTLFATVEGRRYLRCGACRLTFLSRAQLPDRAEEKRQYDLHRNDPDDAGYRRFLGQLAEPLMERLPARARGLDFGCGPGPALARMLEEAGFAMRVWDPIYADQPDALAGPYDFVTCTEVLEHLHQPAREWARFQTLVAPGGWLGVMTRFLTDDGHFPRWHYRRDPTHVCFWQPHTFRWLANRDGWDVVHLANPVVLLRRREGT